MDSFHLTKIPRDNDRKWYQFWKAGPKDKFRMGLGLTALGWVMGRFESSIPLPFLGLFAFIESTFFIAGIIIMLYSLYSKAKKPTEQKTELQQR